VSITSCELLGDQAILVFKVQANSVNFVQVEVDNFQNPPSVDEKYKIQVTRYSPEELIIESTSGSITNLSSLKFATSSMKILNDIIGSKEGVLEFEFRLQNTLPENG
jgi:hypothetical protein